MGPAVVVDPNGLVNCAPRLLSGIEGPADSEFLFEDSVESFGMCVFIAVILLSHAHWKVSTLKDLHILMAAVLTAAIRMVNWISVRREILEGSIQGNEI